LIFDSQPAVRMSSSAPDAGAAARSIAAAGLDGATLRVYEALLSRPGTPAARLGAVLGLAQDRVATALDTLRASGLVDGPATAPVAVPPDVAAEELLALHYARLADESARVAQIRRQLVGMVEVQHEARPEEQLLEIVRGLPAIQARLAELTLQSHNEVLCMVPSATRTLATSSEPLLTTNEDAAVRGLSLRTLVPDSVADDPDGWAYARALIDFGDDVRTCPAIPLVANIFDRRVAAVPLDAEHSRDAAVILTNATLVGGLVSLFEQLWATSLPITVHAPAEPLDERDRQVLQLLLRGAKDDQVARMLGVSVRTVRARIAALTARAGARSRFQLAAVALHHGWIAAE
jgi:DNA-binding CsgD family transcriptional regulator